MIDYPFETDKEEWRNELTRGRLQTDQPSEDLKKVRRSVTGRPLLAEHRNTPLVEIAAAWPLQSRHHLSDLCTVLTTGKNFCSR